MKTIILLTLLSLRTLAADPNKDTVTHGTMSIYFENDTFTGTDRYYTNGVKLSWTSADLEKFSDTPYASPLLPFLNLFSRINDPSLQKNLSFSLGQNIYTPDDTESANPPKDDRPYAGWLYLGVGVVWKNAVVRDSFTLNVGVVGSWSLAEDAQHFVHNIIGQSSPNGWSYQLHNELGVVGVYQRTWRWPVHQRRVGLDWEFLPHAGLAVGNVLTYANLGGEFRAGLNLPDDFGTETIQPGSSTSTPVERDQRATRPRFFTGGAYVFARVDGRAVARNIFLDGNTFGDSRSVDKRPLVADLSVGASVNIRDTKVTYAVVYRTKEFYGQKEGQLFGSITLSVPF